MQEFSVIFRSVKEIGEFVSIANRQPFSVQLLYGSTVLDAGSILSLCCLGLNRPRLHRRAERRVLPRDPAFPYDSVAERRLSLPEVILRPPVSYACTS